MRIDTKKNITDKNVVVNYTLHDAVNERDELKMTSLLKKDAKTYFPNSKNKTFQQSIQLAKESFAKSKDKAKNIEVLKLLLQRRAPIDVHYLEEHLAFCREFYQNDAKSPISNDDLLDFTVNRLTGIEVNSLLKQDNNWVKYIAHLTEKKLTVEKEKMEGWREDKFLPLRIRVLFELMIQAEVGKLDLEKRKALHHELLIQLETLQLVYCIEAIKECTRDIEYKDFRKELSEALAKNINAQLTNWFNMQKLAEYNIELSEYSIPGGWSKHSVYINFTHEGIIRIDNLGNGCETEHEQGEQKGFYYPRILGKTIPSKLPISYITDLIQLAADPDSDRVQALPIIYTKNLGNIQPNTTKSSSKYPASSEQKLGTCVVTSHNVGLQIRNHDIYDWMTVEEMRVLGGLIVKKPSVTFDTYWDKYDKPRQLPKDILQAYQAQCQTHAKISLLLKNRELAIEQSSINLVVMEEAEQEEKDKKLDAQKDEKGKDEKGKDEKSRKDSLSSTEALLQKKAKKSIAVADIFKSCVDKKQVLIEGPAGIGKSTFCQHVIDQWAKGKLWPGQFDWVFHIPLRNLKPDRYPVGKSHSKAGYAAIDLVINECFTNIKLLPWTIRSLEKELEKNTKILWLFDGQDELPSLLPEQLENSLKKLVENSHFIMTSRPHAVQNLAISTRLEIIGFTDDNIEAYVDQFFTDFKATCQPSQRESSSLSTDEMELDPVTVPSSAETLLRFLKHNPNLWSISQVPINLELICSLWQDESKSFEKHVSLTVSQLYQRITLWLSRRYFQKIGVSTSVADDDWVVSHLTSHLRALEKIAFSMMKEEHFELSRDKFQKLISTEKDRTIILELGLLKSSKRNITTNYEFIHLTFQEFFAARYLVSGLKEGRGEHFEEVMQFVREQKYERRLATIFWFTSGLLSLDKTSDGEKASQHFWKAIEETPRDLIGIYHLQLVTRCLDEANYDRRIPKSIQEQLLQHIDKFVIPAITRRRIETKDLKKSGLDNAPFFRQWRMVLHQGTNVLKQSKFITTLVAKLKDATSVKERSVLLNKIQKIGPAAAAHPEVLPALVNALKDKDWEIKEIAVEALETMGPAAIADPEVLPALVNTALKSGSGGNHAARTLRNMSSVAVVLPKVLPTLVGALECGSEVTKWNAIETLHYIADSAATRPAMLRALVTGLRYKKSREEQEERTAIQLIAIMGPAVVAHPDVQSQLVSALKDENWEIRRIAIETLLKMGSATPIHEVLVALAADLRNEDKSVRISAAKLFQILPEDIRPTVAKHPEVLPALAALLKDKDFDTKNVAADVLDWLHWNYSSHYDDSAKKLTINARTQETMSFAATHPQLLSALATTLLATTLQDKEERIKLRTADFLEHMGSTAVRHPDVKATFVAILLNKDRRWSDVMLMRILLLLSKMGPTAASPEVLSALLPLIDKDKNLDIRIGAFKAIGAIFPVTDTADSAMLPILLEAAEHRDRDQCIDELLGSSMAHAAVLKVLPDLLARLTSTKYENKNKYVRQSIAYALKIIRSDDAACPQVILALKTALKDSWWNVRYNAAKALGSIGPAVAADPRVLLNLTTALIESGNGGTSCRETVSDCAVSVLKTMGAAIVAQPEILLTLLNAAFKNKNTDAVSVLKSLGPAAAHQEVVSKLMGALEDQDPFIKKIAADILVGMGSTAAAAQPKIVSALAVALENKMQKTRMSAANALLKMGNALSDEKIIRRALMEANIQTCYFDELEGVISSATAIHPLVLDALITNLVNKIKDGKEVYKAITLLRSVGLAAMTHPDVLKALVIALKGPDADEASNAIAEWPLAKCIESRLRSVDTDAIIHLVNIAAFQGATLTSSIDKLTLFDVHDVTSFSLTNDKQKDWVVELGKICYLHAQRLHLPIDFYPSSAKEIPDKDMPQAKSSKPKSATLLRNKRPAENGGQQSTGASSSSESVPPSSLVAKSSPALFADSSSSDEERIKRRRLSESAEVCEQEKMNENPTQDSFIEL